MATRKGSRPAEPPRQGFWVRIIEAVDKSLGFFVLALLIMDACITIILICSNLSEEHTFYGMLCGMVIFLIEIVVVSLLVFFRSHNLVYGEQAHLIDRGKVPYGSHTNPVSDLEALQSSAGRPGSPTPADEAPASPRSPSPTEGGTEQ